MTFENTKISSMNAMRTTFMFGKFTDTNFDKCYLDKCSFANSELKNIYFRESTIIVFCSKN